ncbi:cytochrome P450 [Aspergillus heteromorphus CBS 117.55]|uniref:Cytochrome P450 n=1 Tax=Aspergillus heteromorphus CBS 117.55 TaxID=1448321 RepID=A0A317VQ06_9EURO|nr:cytochrome P450 [Aspergillus heteromorphus CBS 117.55]PWY75351.1 cytochrome P450 [Aspergillus heteromorphus CBS 117.55]
MALWAAGVRVLTRHLGIQPESSAVLLGEIIGSWLVLNALLLGLKTWYRRRYSPFRDIPGPEPGPWLYGHAFDIFDEPLGRRITDWGNAQAYPHGLMHFFGLFGVSYLVPTSPAALAEVLSTRAYDYVKPAGFKRFTRRFWGHGIVSQEQEEHRLHRKTYQAVFNQGNIAQARGPLSTKSRQLVDRIHGLCAPSPSHSAIVPVTQLTARVSLDVTGLIALGVDFETILDRNPQVLEAHEALFAGSRDKRTLFALYNAAPRWLGGLIPLRVARRMDEASRVLRGACRQAIRSRAAVKANGQRLDFVAHLVQQGLYDEEAAISQIMVILGAGYESTGGTLAWILYCLATHPDSQAALRQEVRSRSRPMDESDYEALPLLNAVVLEATRLYPAFSFLLRKTIRATAISGRAIPRGTYVALCPHMVNHARHLWGPDVEAFRPERWVDRSSPAGPKLDATGGASAAVCMLSFFSGARSCVGRALALALMKRQVALLVDHFQLDPVGGTPQASGLFATSPPADLHVRFTQVR